MMLFLQVLTIILVACTQVNATESIDDLNKQLQKIIVIRAQMDIHGNCVLSGDNGLNDSPECTMKRNQLDMQIASLQAQIKKAKSEPAKPQPQPAKPQPQPAKPQPQPEQPMPLPPYNDGGYNNGANQDHNGNGHGHGHNDNGYSHSGVTTITCESQNYSQRVCDIPGTLLNLLEIRQLSSSECLINSSVFISSNAISVSQGCRAEFIIEIANGHVNPPSYSNNIKARYVITKTICESENYLPTSCILPSGIVRVLQITQVFSKSSCTSPQNFRFDASPNRISVFEGCRAEFLTQIRQ